MGPGREHAHAGHIRARPYLVGALEGAVAQAAKLKTENAALRRQLEELINQRERIQEHRRRSTSARLFGPDFPRNTI